MFKHSLLGVSLQLHVKNHILGKRLILVRDLGMHLDNLVNVAASQKNMPKPSVGKPSASTQGGFAVASQHNCQSSSGLLPVQRGCFISFKGEIGRAFCHFKADVLSQGMHGMLSPVLTDPQGMLLHQFEGGISSGPSATSKGMFFLGTAGDASPPIRKEKGACAGMVGLLPSHRGYSPQAFSHFKGYVLLTCLASAAGCSSLGVLPDSKNNSLSQGLWPFPFQIPLPFQAPSMWGIFRLSDATISGGKNMTSGACGSTLRCKCRYLQKLFLRHIFRQIRPKGRDPDFLARLLLAAHICLRVATTAHQHDCQPRDLHIRNM
jgi:hypothetical protein